MTARPSFKYNMDIGHLEKPYKDISIYSDKNGIKDTPEFKNRTIKQKDFQIEKRSLS